MKISYDINLPASTVATDQTSDLIELENGGGFAIQAIFTGTPNGTIRVEATNTNPKLPILSAQFVKIFDFRVNTSQSIMIPFDNVWFGWARVKWVASSGSGTVEYRCRTKGF